jgi:hypothetical protein
MPNPIPTPTPDEIVSAGKAKNGVTRRKMARSSSSTHPQSLATTNERRRARPRADRRLSILHSRLVNNPEDRKEGEREGEGERERENVFLPKSKFGPRSQMSQHRTHSQDPSPAVQARAWYRLPCHLQSKIKVCCLCCCTKQNPTKNSQPRVHY